MNDNNENVMVIPKEKAVFRLDKHGVWHTAQGKFENQRIINHFHAAIKKDKDGFFLEQEHSKFTEKVYFPYEETALFVFHILQDDGLILQLNTGEQIRVEPEKLYVNNDSLYMEYGEEIIKFTENAMLLISKFLDDEDDEFCINIDGKRYPIKEKR